MTQGRGIAGNEVPIQISHRYGNYSHGFSQKSPLVWAFNPFEMKVYRHLHEIHQRHNSTSSYMWTGRSGSKCGHCLIGLTTLFMNPTADSNKGFIVPIQIHLLDSSRLWTILICGGGGSDDPLRLQQSSEDDPRRSSCFCSPGRRCHVLHQITGLCWNMFCSFPTNHQKPQQKPWGERHTS